jgi:spore germination cell wall hydrolase CwlJ-like protein
VGVLFNNGRKVMNKILITILLIVGISTTYVLTDLMSNPVESNIFSPENVERVRQNIPKEYVPEPTVSLEEPEQVVIDPLEVECMQKNIYFESRDQSVKGQRATAWVTINRVNSIDYPSTVCDVVYQGVHDRNGNPVRDQCQFSWYCDGKSDKPHSNAIERRAWKLAGEIAQHMIENCLTETTELCPDDSTGGALYYHTKDVAPNWFRVTVSANIGSHIYYTKD